MPVTLARALSKMGLCSRSIARTWIEQGRVKVNGRIERAPDSWIALGKAKIEVADAPAPKTGNLYVMLNKPRGMVTTTSDEKGRSTVYDCFKDAGFPWMSPVGRLDMASEGLLLFTNDTRWAAWITEPTSHVTKVYDVQVDSTPDDALLQRMRTGVRVDGELMNFSDVHVLRQGGKNAWLQVTLDEGKNRQIRRVLEALGLNVKRLVRVAIGPVRLGDVAKGAHRELTPDEVKALGPVSL